MCKQITVIVGFLILASGTGAVVVGVVGSLRGDLLFDDDDHSFPAAARRSRQLDQQEPEVWQCAEFRTQTVQAVIAGDMSLLQAAARFRELNQHRAEVVDQILRDNYPECTTEEERLCRQVITHVEIALNGDPRKEAVIRRLFQELSDYRDGPSTSQYAYPSVEARPLQLKD